MRTAVRAGLITLLTAACILLSLGSAEGQIIGFGSTRTTAAGVGSCGNATVVTATNDNAAPTCSSSVLPVNTAATSNNFLTAYDFSTGAFSKAQPAVSNLSDTKTGSGNLVLATTPVLNKPTIGIAGTSASSHIVSAGTAPTVACTGTGTSPAAPTLLGTDAAFIVTMSTGTGSPGNTGTCTVTFNGAYVTNKPVMACMLVSGSTAWGNTATVRLTTESLTAPVLTWMNVVNGTATALTVSTNYKIACIVVQE